MNQALFPPVIVDGVEISASSIAAEAQNHAAPKGKPGLAWRKAARALIVRHLLLREAEALGISAEPRALGNGRRETIEDAQIAALLDQTLEAEVVSDEDVKAEWERDPSRFKTPPLWEASHILCETEGAAKALIIELNEGARFGDLAKEHSQCGSAEAGGFLGQLSPNDTIPEFEIAMSALEEGAITQTPVQTRFGFHIIRLDAKEDGRQLLFEAAQNRVREALERAAWVQAARSYTSELMDKAQIEGIILPAEAPKKETAI